MGENMKNVIKTQENVAKLNKNVTKGDEIVTFDYTSVDGKTADFLQDKAEKIAAIRMRSVMAIGKELSETFEKFSKLPYGNKTEMFDQWCESIGITSRTARNYINGYEYILKNFQLILWKISMTYILKNFELIIFPLHKEGLLIFMANIVSRKGMGLCLVYTDLLKKISVGVKKL